MTFYLFLAALGTDLASSKEIMSGPDKVYRGTRENLVLVTKVLKFLFAFPVKC